MGAAGSKLEKALGDQFPEGERYFEFENFGNTCYCNRLGGGLTAGIGFKYWYLALYFCVPFCEQLLEYYTGNRSVADAEENLMICLADLFLQISSQKKKTGVIAPKRFVQRLKKHSYLSLNNETRCLRCETVTARDDSFLDLSLDIEQNRTKLLNIFNDILANFI